MEKGKKKKDWYAVGKDIFTGFGKVKTSIYAALDESDRRAVSRRTSELKTLRQDIEIEKLKKKRRELRGTSGSDNLGFKF